MDDGPGTISIEFAIRIPHEHDATNNRLPRMNNKTLTHASEQNITNASFA